MVNPNLPHLKLNDSPELTALEAIIECKYSGSAKHTAVPVNQLVWEK